ncbi:hypothetical protein C8Q70DRAFT_913949 [Cubamyces menziesii]|nr:hypothetical protein C8Q70DRAFT_913949 [Cubamyces menziesii]
MSTVPPAKKRARVTSAERDNGVSSASKARSRTGKLAGIMQMPVDVFLQIALHLHPLDLLHLVRTSKGVRSLLLSRRNRSVWTASLSSVEGLPACPPDMSEPAYSALLFGRTCNLCGANRAGWVDYAIRLRLCKACHQTHIRPGSHILYGVDSDHARLFMAMTPCETGKDTSAAKKLQDPFKHTGKEKYYDTQLRAVASRPFPYGNFPNAGQTYDEWMKAFFAHTIAVHNHASALLEWEWETSWQRECESRELKRKFKEAVIEKLVALGYPKEDLPYSREWKRLVKQPKELTDRVWNNLRPKLEEFLRQEKERTRRNALDIRARPRREQIVKYYEDFVQGLPHTERGMMPNAADACRLPCLVELAEKNDANGDVSADEFLALTDEVMQEAEQYKVRAKETVYRIMVNELDHYPGRKQWFEEVKALSPDEALDRHWSLFQCWAKNCWKGFFTFGELHAHWRTAHPWRSWEETTPQDSPCFLGKHYMGGALLEAAGLSRDTPMTALNELVKSGRLYCSCGDPALPAPEELDWPRLAAHIYTQSDRHQTVSGQRRQVRGDDWGSRLVLKSTHEQTGPNACLKLIPEGADTAKGHERASTIDPEIRTLIEERLALRPSPDASLVCRICRDITNGTYMRFDGWRKRALPETPEGIVHHLRTW